MSTEACEHLPIIFFSMEVKNKLSSSFTNNVKAALNKSEALDSVKLSEILARRGDFWAYPASMNELLN